VIHSTVALKLLLNGVPSTILVSKDLTVNPFFRAILEKENVKDRANIIVAILGIAKHLRKLGNFASLNAIICSLADPSVARLKQVLLLFFDALQFESHSIRRGQLFHKR
jgi:hypothetical protein